MIDIVRVSKSYGTTVAVADVSFTVPAGAVTGFVGPNGAGKSTVLRMIAGLAKPDSGEVLVDGVPFASSQRPATTIGIFLSAEAIPPRVSARGFLEYMCDTQGLDRSRVGETLTMVGLAHVGEARVQSFSLGMRQRLGIGAAAIGRPAILVLDEPINGLDPDGIHWLRTFLSSAADAGATVLLSSHHMSELSMVADRVVMLNSGTVVAEGTLDEFVSNEESESVYVESPDLSLVRSALTREGISSEVFKNGLRVHTASALDVGRIAFASGAGASHLATLPRSLEETYFEHLSTTSGRIAS